MNSSEFSNKLYSKYSRLFSDAPHITCGPGWYDLVEQLTEELYNASLDYCIESVIVDTIKEKCGGLRYYVHYNLPEEEITELEQIIIKFEKYSRQICEWCGHEGDIDKGSLYWMPNLCNNCKKDGKLYGH